METQITVWTDCPNHIWSPPHINSCIFVKYRTEQLSANPAGSERTLHAGGFLLERGHVTGAWRISKGYVLERSPNQRSWPSTPSFPNIAACAHPAWSPRVLKRKRGQHRFLTSVERVEGFQSPRGSRCFSHTSGQKMRFRCFFTCRSETRRHVFCSAAYLHTIWQIVTLSPTNSLRSEKSSWREEIWIPPE